MAVHYGANANANVVPDDLNEYQEGVSQDWTAILANQAFVNLDHINLCESIFCRHAVGTIALSVLYRDAAGHTRSADETLFGRVYVDPLEANPGFITENRDYAIVVWNADLENISTITSVSVLNQDGTTLTYSALPKDIPRGYDEVMTLTVLGEGPPTQDTQYTIVVGSYSYEVDVQGIRAVPLEADPDWAAGISIDYAWLTAMGFNPRYYKEQRRPMTILPWRNISATFALSGNSAMKFSNSLRYGKDKVFVVPIFTEQILCSNIATGTDSITPSNAYDEYYNLNNNCTHVLFLDLASLTSEIKEISSVGASTITFASNITGTFDAASTVIYPAVFSTIRNISSKGETSNLEVIRLSFEEFKKSG